ncbi:MAG: glycosyl transferase group 1 [Candidatus Levybacteria bacterium]|nr:glycosyl transferase group 1 [Candidatus Levybacteria bacterium]
MKVAIVHDYIKEFGGAERVLEALCEIYPDAPIYTAFYDAKGTAYEHFKHKKIIPSWAHYVPFFATKLHSPLRFLAPLIWESFDLSDYDVVISSASWYITKGFRKRFDKSHFKEICYCHTPPRWLYGYTTSVNFQKYPLIKAYAAIVGHLMRLYDFKAAQKVDYFIANSKEVAGRIKKFYRRDSTVIYPPVSLPKSEIRNPKSEKDYYLIVSRIVGAKGLELAIAAAQKAGFKLKIAGSPSGYYKLPKNNNVEFLGQVKDEELVKLYQGAKGFLALSKDEDFGITPVEAMLCGTPVIAFNGGGYKETVLQGRTGVLFDDYSVDGLIKAIKQFNNLTINSNDCVTQAQKFSKERFVKEIRDFVVDNYKSRG